MYGNQSTARWFFDGWSEELGIVPFEAVPDPPAPIVPGVGPAGAASFVLDIEAGATVTYSWRTDVIKAHNGFEQRISLGAAPAQRYNASAYLVDAAERTIRTALLTAPAQGQPFLLGLPYEELSLAADASGSTVFVGSTTLSDWVQPGQRVVVVGLDGTTVDAVVQSSGPTTIVLDPAPGAAAGAEHGRIMPAMAIYLEPSQGLARHIVNVAHWQISARAGLFGYANVVAMGVGASVTTYGGFTVYSYRSDHGDDTAANSIQTLGEMLDAGALPIAMGGADVVDMLRELRLASSSRVDWQWFKLFLFTVRGRQVLFLLPTWRPDLVFDSNPGSFTLVVKSADTPGAGDFLAYWNDSQAQTRLQVLKADGSVQYVAVEDVFDNADGTLDLILDATVTGTVAMISFLELCRLESDDVAVTWGTAAGGAGGWSFESTLLARVVQQ